MMVTMFIQVGAIAETHCGVVERAIIMTANQLV